MANMDHFEHLLFSSIDVKVICASGYFELPGVNSAHEIVNASLKLETDLSDLLLCINMMEGFDKASSDPNTHIHILYMPNYLSLIVCCRLLQSVSIMFKLLSQLSWHTVNQKRTVVGLVKCWKVGLFGGRSAW